MTQQSSMYSIPHVDPGMFNYGGGEGGALDFGGVNTLTPEGYQSLQGFNLPSFLKSAVGATNPNGTQTQGWGGLALSGLSTGANLFMGMKQYGLAKDSLKENKRQYNQNFAAQQKTTNAQMEDRQNARVASNAGAYESVGSYMQRNRV